MTPTAAIEKTRNIQNLRTIVSLIKDTPVRVGLRTRLYRLCQKTFPALRVLACMRFAFMPLKRHQWCLVFDSNRAPKREHETTYDFLYRIGRTNRTYRLPDLLKIKSDDQIVAVDMGQTTSAQNGTYGTLPFLFATAGPLGVLCLLWDIVQGWLILKSIKSALIYAGLRLVAGRVQKTESGLLMTTSISWLAEVLRVGLSSARVDLDIVEVLHGAGTQNTGPYFQWVHDQAKTPTRYINLIAGLPRYAPLKHHMMQDEIGEISCNIRMWQGRSDAKITVPRAVSEQHSIVFVGGASIDPNYAKSSFFKKELDMLQLLQDHGLKPVFYAPHPIHSSETLNQILPQIRDLGATIQTETTLELILGASIVVGGFSTSLIEAALLDVPSFAYEDFATLFIPKTADLVTWNTNMAVLTGCIAKAYQTVSAADKTTHIVHTEAQATRCFGLHVVSGKNNVKAF